MLLKCGVKTVQYILFCIVNTYASQPKLDVDAHGCVQVLCFVGVDTAQHETRVPALAEVDQVLVVAEHLDVLYIQVYKYTLQAE